MKSFTAEALGDPAFRADYGIQYACLAGAMYKGIASVDLVVAMGRKKLLGFFGTGGMKLDKIEQAIHSIQEKLPSSPYGFNLLCNIVKPALEESTVNLFLRHGVINVEAAAFMQITEALTLFRLKGLTRNKDGKIDIRNRIIAKVSRPETAEAFMHPAPEKIINQLVESGRLSQEEGQLGREIPVSHDICVESDSAGHTDQRIALTMLPTIGRLRNEIMKKHGYPTRIRVGAAGGIGTPEAAAACFILGADFILTGSINQCTVESGASDKMKGILQEMNVQDTAYAPAGDMFELGAKIQVVKRGLLFPARANKLYDLYRQFDSWEQIDEKTRSQIEKNYFCRTFADVWNETRSFYLSELPAEIEKAEKNPKSKMALVFRWYFVHSSRLALKGMTEQPSDYQIHSGSAMGAFNQWVKGTPMESWKNRHVDEITEKLMQETAEYLNNFFSMGAV